MQQSIKLLTTGNKKTLIDQRDIIRETHSFYTTLYTPEGTEEDAQRQIFAVDIPKLSKASKECCEGYITCQELRKALTEMNSGKSPGLDGLTTKFYQYFWNILGEAMTEVYNYSFENGLLTISQRRGIITLIFKKNDHTQLKNWRPITLLTADYKILTKALASRLKNVLHEIIHTDQTACIPGRTINDNSSLIRDAIYYAKEKDIPLAVITIDQLKAFDRVDHDFLFKTLDRFNFGPQFISWIKLLYNGVSSSVKVNGWMTAFVQLRGGLLQGWPLSMSLYILTAEIMAINIRSNNNIKGLQIPNSRDEAKLSQYADDTALLLAEDISANHSFKTLELYERASGAKINMEKCKGLWAGLFKTRNDQLLGFDWYNDYIPEKILGLYHGNIDCTQMNLTAKLSKIEGIINAWTHRDLSFRGKALVINGLLTSTLWYMATTLHIPEESIRDLETVIYNFFWSGKAHLVNRDILSLPLCEGGFNIQRIETKIYALRINTIKRLLDSSTAHWKHLLEHFLRTANLNQER